MSVADQAIEDPLCGDDTNVANCGGSSFSNLFIIINLNVSASKKFLWSSRGGNARVTSVRSKEARTQKFDSDRNFQYIANTSSSSQENLKAVLDASADSY